MKVWLVFVENDEENSPYVFSNPAKALSFCEDMIRNDEDLIEEEVNWALEEMVERAKENINEFGAEYSFYCYSREVA